MFKIAKYINPIPLPNENLSMDSIWWIWFTYVASRFVAKKWLAFFCLISCQFHSHINLKNFLFLVKTLHVVNAISCKKVTSDNYFCTNYNLFPLHENFILGLLSCSNNLWLSSDNYYHCCSIWTSEINTAIWPYHV